MQSRNGLRTVGDVQEIEVFYSGEFATKFKLTTAQILNDLVQHFMWRNALLVSG